MPRLDCRLAGFVSDEVLAGFHQANKKLLEILRRVPLSNDCQTSRFR